PESKVAAVTVAQRVYYQLATVVSFSAVGVDSARVIYSAEGEPTLSAPCTRIPGASARIVTLGLKANIGYSFRVVACGGSAVGSSSVSVASGSLPAPLEDVATLMTGTPT